MRFDAALAAAAVLMLAAAPVLAAPAEPGLRVGYCGIGGASGEIPIPGKPRHPRDEKCALACHAAALRKKYRSEKRCR